MKKIRPDRVAIYVRWSTDDQSEGTTLDVQLDGCRHYAMSQGWLPQDSLTFIDDGYSGGNLMRPALTKLRALIKAGEVDCVVVLKVDRLSRNIVDAVELVLNEWKDRCYFKSAREPIDTGSDLGRVIFGILAMFADFERSQIRERTQSGKVKRIAEGKQLHGEPAFGYRPSGVKGQWEEAPEEAEIVRRMFRMAAGGQSANGICRILNGEGIRTRAGKQWSIRGVLWVLHNRLYLGEAVYGRTQLKMRTSPADKRKTERLTREQPIVRTQTQAAPSLITVDLFDQVQSQLERNRVARREYGSRSLSSPHLLVGLARCRCGGTLVVKQHERYANYFCHNTRGGRCGHGPGYINQARADQIVLAQFVMMYGTRVAREARFQIAAEQVERHLANLIPQRTAIEKSLASLHEQENRLMRAARSGELDLKDLRDLRVGIERDRREIQERLASLDTEIAEAKKRLDKNHETMSRLSEVERLHLLTTEQKRELLRCALAGPIILYKAKGSEAIEAYAPWGFLTGQ